MADASQTFPSCTVAAQLPSIDSIPFRNTQRIANANVVKHIFGESGDGPTSQYVRCLQSQQRNFKMSTRAADAAYGYTAPLREHLDPILNPAPPAATAHRTTELFFTPSPPPKDDATVPPDPTPSSPCTLQHFLEHSNFFKSEVTQLIGQPPANIHLKQKSKTKPRIEPLLQSRSTDTELVRRAKPRIYDENVVSVEEHLLQRDRMTKLLVTSLARRIAKITPPCSNELLASAHYVASVQGADSNAPNVPNGGVLYSNFFKATPPPKQLRHLQRRLVKDILHEQQQAAAETAQIITDHPDGEMTEILEEILSRGPTMRQQGTRQRQSRDFHFDSSSEYESDEEEEEDSEHNTDQYEEPSGEHHSHGAQNGEERGVSPIQRNAHHRGSEIAASFAPEKLPKRKKRVRKEKGIHHTTSRVSFAGELRTEGPERQQKPHSFRNIPRVNSRSTQPIQRRSRGSLTRRVNKNDVSPPRPLLNKREATCETYARQQLYEMDLSAFSGSIEANLFNGFETEEELEEKVDALQTVLKNMQNGKIAAEGTFGYADLDCGSDFWEEEEEQPEKPQEDTVQDDPPPSEKEEVLASVSEGGGGGGEGEAVVLPAVLPEVESSLPRWRAEPAGDVSYVVPRIALETVMQNPRVAFFLDRASLAKKDSFRGNAGKIQFDRSVERGVLDARILTMRFLEGYEELVKEIASLEEDFRRQLTEMSSLRAAHYAAQHLGYFDSLSATERAEYTQCYGSGLAAVAGAAKPIGAATISPEAAARLAPNARVLLHEGGVWKEGRFLELTTGQQKVPNVQIGLAGIVAKPVVRAFLGAMVPLGAEVAEVEDAIDSVNIKTMSGITERLKQLQGLCSARDLRKRTESIQELMNQVNMKIKTDHADALREVTSANAVLSLHEDAIQRRIDETRQEYFDLSMSLTELESQQGTLRHAVDTLNSKTNRMKHKKRYRNYIFAQLQEIFDCDDDARQCVGCADVAIQKDERRSSLLEYQDGKSVVIAQEIKQLSTTVERMLAFTEQLEQMLRCRVCNSVCKSLHQLWPCGHSFCSACIDLCLSDTTLGLWRCLECHKVTATEHVTNRCLTQLATRWVVKGAGHRDVAQSLKRFVRELEMVSRAEKSLKSS